MDGMGGRRVNHCLVITWPIWSIVRVSIVTFQSHLIVLMVEVASISVNLTAIWTDPVYKGSCFSLKSITPNRI